MQNESYYIGESDFRVFIPDLTLSETEGEAFNSRRIFGIMSTERLDRQDERVIAKGLDFQDFLSNGHFNDNHSQGTSDIVGYPEEVKHHADLGLVRSDLTGTPGWTCRGYVLKGTAKADAIWELAKALQHVPNRKLGFSIEGKVLRRSNKCIEKARIRNVAITNCPVNTDATWGVLAKSFVDSDVAIKALAAGYGASPDAQSGGGALRQEDLDGDFKHRGPQVDPKKRAGAKNKKEELEGALKRALHFDDLMKAMEMAHWSRPDFSDDALAAFAAHLLKMEMKYGRVDAAAKIGKAAR